MEFYTWAIALAIIALASAEDYNVPEYGRALSYYTAWSIYGRNYQIADIPFNHLSHINYAFANIQGGVCKLGDKFADVEKAYPGDSWNQKVKGNFHQLNNISKQAHPHLKTLISVGGWLWSKDFSNVAATEKSREKFVSSCVGFMKMYGFDGVDLDWEYPGGGGMPTNVYRKEDGKNYGLLVKKFREELDKNAAGYLLSIAAPSGTDKIKHLDMRTMAKYIDFFNLMTYDYNSCGTPGTKVVAHHSNLYYNKDDPLKNDEVYNIDTTVKAFIAGGVHPKQLSVGAAFYGRGYDGVKGPDDREGFLFQSFDGCPAGTWDNWETGNTGTFDYWDLVRKSEKDDEGWTRHWDDQAKAPYLVRQSPWTENEVMVISYDDAESCKAKAKYVRDLGLGGVFSWSLDGDDKGALTEVLFNAMQASPSPSNSPISYSPSRSATSPSRAPTQTPSPGTLSPSPTSPSTTPSPASPSPSADLRLLVPHRIPARFTDCTSIPECSTCMASVDNRDGDSSWCVWVHDKNATADTTFFCESSTLMKKKVQEVMTLRLLSTCPHSKNPKLKKEKEVEVPKNHKKVVIASDVMKSFGKKKSKKKGSLLDTTTGAEDTVDEDADADADVDDVELLQMLL